MQIDIYGFKAHVSKDGKYYAATVRELHANTQARSLKELKENLKEVVRLVFEDVLHNEKEYNAAIVSKVKANLIQNLA
jgi:predicted RNase H-like HicB family nuclease